MNEFDLYLDFESMGYPPEGAIINLAAIAFLNDPYNPPHFLDLVESAFFVKFDIKAQKGQRVFDAGVIDFWKEKASPEARLQLKPSPDDILVNDGLDKFLDYCKMSGIDQRWSQLWTRGNAFDLPLLVDMIRRRYRTRETFDLEPVRFWNIRDTRTAIESTLLTRGMCSCPLPKGVLDGFIHHNAVHDCAKDIMMLIYAKRYAMGLEELPTDPDPITVR